MQYLCFLQFTLSVDYVNSFITFNYIYIIMQISIVYHLCLKVVHYKVVLEQHYPLIRYFFFLCPRLADGGQKSGDSALSPTQSGPTGAAAASVCSSIKIINSTRPNIQEVQYTLGSTAAAAASRLPTAPGLTYRRYSIL